jgi:hypothetical protein
MHNAVQADLDKLAACFSECDADLASRFSCERRESRIHVPRIARRCPGRTNEQTCSSSVSERGRQRLQSAIRASGASNQTLREQLYKANQCVVTPLALSHGCGLIALYTSPYLTPAG